MIRQTEVSFIIKSLRFKWVTLFEDLPWFPESIRNYGTDFLQFLSNQTKMFEPAIPALSMLLEHSDEKKIIDLASGGGGGLLWLNEQLRKKFPGLKIVLTDLYPNVAAFRYIEKQADNFQFINEPVDATHVPHHLKGIRTMFLSFHHFRPGKAKEILRNAVDTNSPIAIFEGQERSIPSLIAMFFSPVTLLLTIPFIRPFRWKRLLFTYLIPIVPLFVWWDGIVSSLRTYSVKEMNQLIGSLKNKDKFHWEIGKRKKGPVTIPYLIGYPKSW